VQTDVTASSPAVFAAISGASSTNTITIDGGSKIYTYSGSYEAISFAGADYVTIKNAVVRNSATGAYAGLIRFSGASNYNKIDNSTLEFSALASATTGTYYVALANSATGISSPTSATNGISNTVLLVWVILLLILQRVMIIPLRTIKFKISITTGLSTITPTVINL